MAYQSLLGYAKDGIAEVVASTKSTMNDINHWALDAYRNLKLYSPATGELKTWLEANAVRLPLTGTWVFNSKLNESATKSKTITGNVEFVSNNISYTNMTINYGSSMGENGYTISDISYNTTQVNTVDAWSNQAYRTITFTQPVKYEGNEEFVRWFVDNAAPPPQRHNAR